MYALASGKYVLPGGADDYVLPGLEPEQVFGFLGLELLEEGRTITSEESSLLRIFSLDIAHLIEDSRLFEQSKALITAEERNRIVHGLRGNGIRAFLSCFRSGRIPHLGVSLGGGINANVLAKPLLPGDPACVSHDFDAGGAAI
jgi:hypothetical protein